MTQSVFSVFASLFARFKVLGALKSHPTSYKVASGVCSALRLFLSPRAGADRESSNVATRRAIEVQKHALGEISEKLWIPVVNANAL